MGALGRMSIRIFILAAVLVALVTPFTSADSIVQVSASSQNAEIVEVAPKPPSRKIKKKAKRSKFISAAPPSVAEGDESTYMKAKKARRARRLVEVDTAADKTQAASEEDGSSPEGEDGSESTTEVGEGEEEEEAEGEEEEGEEDYVVVYYYLIVALLIGMITFKIINTMKLSVPYTVAVFVEGFVVGGVHYEFFEASTGNFGNSLEMWVGINPHLLLYSLLPILIFGDSMKLNFEIVKGCTLQCLLLAGPGVLFGSLATAFFAQYALPYGWDFKTALCFGSILSATDPVAVVGLLNELGCSKVLSMQIAGESLLNDGTAMAVWTVAFNMMKGTEYTVAELFKTFCQLALAGFALGILWGALCVIGISKSADHFSHNDTVMQVALTVLCAYTAFYFSDHECESSGILATVFGALVVARMAWSHVIDVHSMESFWHMVEFFANTIIFFLAGTVISEAIVNRSKHLSIDDWGWMLVVYLTLLVIRAVMVLLFYPFLARMGFGTNWKDATVIVWGGLRGAVGLALALCVDAQFGGKTGTLFLFHIGGIAMLTLVVNAPTCKPLLNRLGMTRRSWAEDDMVDHLRTRQAAKTYQNYTHYVNSDRRFSQLHHKLMHEWVSALGEYKEDADGQGMKITESKAGTIFTKPEMHARKRTVKKHGHDKRKTNFASFISNKSFTDLARDRTDTDASAVHTQSSAASQGGDFADKLSVARIQQEATTNSAGCATVQLQAGPDDMAVGNLCSIDKKAYQSLASQIQNLGEQDKSAEALMDEREFFYAAVRAEYQHMLKEGLLPRRSRTVTLLLAAVDYGEAHCDWEICDWEKVLHSIACGHATNNKYAAKVRQWWRDFRDGTLIGKTMLPIRRRHVTFDLLTVVTFMDAHQGARLKIQETIEDSPLQLHKAMVKVFHESQLQINQAQQFIVQNNIGQDIYALVRSFQLALYLLLQQQEMVDEWVKIGAVTETDAHELLHEVEEDFSTILHASEDLRHSGYTDPHVEDELLLPEAYKTRISERKTMAGNVMEEAAWNTMGRHQKDGKATGQGRLHRYSRVAVNTHHGGGLGLGVLGHGGGSHSHINPATGRAYDGEEAQDLLEGRLRAFSDQAGTASSESPNPDRKVRIAFDEADSKDHRQSMDSAEEVSHGATVFGRKTDAALDQKEAEAPARPQESLPATEEPESEAAASAPEAANAEEPADGEEGDLKEGEQRRRKRKSHSEKKSKKEKKEKKRNKGDDDEAEEGGEGGEAEGEGEGEGEARASPRASPRTSTTEVAKEVSPEAPQDAPKAAPKKDEDE